MASRAWPGKVREANLGVFSNLSGVTAVSPERDSLVTGHLAYRPIMPRPPLRRATQFASLAAALILAWAVPGPAWAAAPTPADSLVVVELFTSQGCSSCPPADALLDELSRRTDVIALSLHIDYWDYIGWKDPYGSAQNTERQRRYAEELGLRYIYTPQIVIDGRYNIVGSRRDEVLATIEKAAARPKPMAIEFIPSDGGRVVIPQGHAPDRGATIWLAVFDEGQDTYVKRGENAGRTIRNTNIVRRMERLGTWMGERLEIPLNLDSAAAHGNFACAVLVQHGRNGPIIGAGLMRLDSLVQ